MRRDILQKFPFLDTYFDRTVAPEDNVSFALFLPCYQWVSAVLTIHQPF